MIPRIKPYFDSKEVNSLITPNKEATNSFEEKFAKTVKADYSLVFPYGRSGLYAILKSLDIYKSQIIMPAYSCVVMANAIIKSNNYPLFVDCAKDDFNMDLKKANSLINKKTKAIIPTSMFGYPVDLKEIEKIQRKNILVIQDNALALNSKYKNKLVSNQGDLTLHSLTWSKHLCTIEGGVITTNNFKLYSKLKKFRDLNYKKPSINNRLGKLSISVFSNLIFNNSLYGFIKLLENKGFLNKYVNYYDESKINLPYNYNELFSNIQSKIGLSQLNKYGEIISKRNALVKRYNKKLSILSKKIKLPVYVKGANYSHYPILVEKRDELITKAISNGIDLGKMFDYSIPHLKAYKKYKNNKFNNSLNISKKIINLPIYPSLSYSNQNKIINFLINYYGN